MNEPKIVGRKLHLDGHLYVKSREGNSKTYWDCRRIRRRECKARAITTTDETGKIVVLKGPTQSIHTHPPDRAECAADKAMENMRIAVESNPTDPPLRVIREQFANLNEDVLSRLPERENIKKTLRRQRQLNLPPNPRNLADLRELPPMYTVTSSNERFLLYDSNDAESRVLVFATRKNLELLAESGIWFLDGTFSVTPSIFTQVSSFDCIFLLFLRAIFDLRFLRLLGSSPGLTRTVKKYKLPSH